MTILVAYASKYGATEQIAAFIGQCMHDAGLSVVVADVTTIRDLSDYTAIVVGSAVYAGQWQADAVSFLVKHAQDLATMPVWLFSSGPTGAGDPLETLKGWRFPKSLQETIDYIRPNDTAVFHGYLNMDAINIAERFIIKAMRVTTGDYRDWEMIEAWAKRIIDTLKISV